MRCDQCKHWNEKEVIYDEMKNSQGKIALCKKAIEAWEATEWAKDEDGDDSYTDRVMKEEYKDLKMFVKDGSSYAAYFYTRADFFCAHFEEKPKEPKDFKDIVHKYKTQEFNQETLNALINELTQLNYVKYYVDVLEHLANIQEGKSVE